MEDVTTDNPMNSTNLARRSYYNQQRINNGVASPMKTRSNVRTPSKSHRKTSQRSATKSHRKSRKKSRRSRSRRRHRYESESDSSESSESDVDVNDSFDRMSICSNNENKSRGSTRQRVSKDHHSSGHYSETTSQCRHRLKGKQRKIIGIVENEERRRIQRMSRAELEELDRGINEEATRRNYDLRSEASIPVVVTTNPDGTTLVPELSRSHNSDAIFSTPSSKLSDAFHSFSFRASVTDQQQLPNNRRASVSQSGSDSL